MEIEGRSFDIDGDSGFTSVTKDQQFQHIEQLSEKQRSLFLSSTQFTLLETEATGL